MSVLSQVVLAAPAIGIATPSVVFSGTDDTSLAIQSCLNRTAQMIAYSTDHDWTQLKAFATITGDGVTTAWPLPADYHKMLKVAQLWSSKTPMTPITHYADTNRYLGLLVQAFLPIFGAWTMIGTKLNIIPARATGETVKYGYIISNPVLDNTGAAKAAFTADTDTVFYPEILLQLGFIYMWKQDKGLDYGEAMEDFHTQLAIAIGGDRGSMKLVAGRQRAPMLTGQEAFPRTVGP